MKELSNDAKDKENISIYNKYFQKILAVRSKKKNRIL